MAQNRVHLHARSCGVQVNPYDTILTSTDPFIYVVDGRKVPVARVRSLPPPPHRCPFHWVDRNVLGVRDCACSARRGAIKRARFLLPLPEAMARFQATIRAHTSRVVTGTAILPLSRTVLLVPRHPPLPSNPLFPSLHGTETRCLPSTPPPLSGVSSPQVP